MRRLKKLSPILIIVLTFIFMGSTATALDYTATIETNFNAFYEDATDVDEDATLQERFACNSITSYFISSCQAPIDVEIGGATTSEVQWSIANSGSVASDNRQQTLGQVMQNLNSSYGVSIAEAKTESIQQLNNGSSEANAVSVSTDIVRSWYSEIQRNVHNYRNRHILKANTSVNEVKQTSGLSISDVFRVKGVNGSGSVDWVAPESINVSDGNKTLYNGKEATSYKMSVEIPVSSGTKTVNFSDSGKKLNTGLLNTVRTFSFNGAPDETFVIDQKTEEITVNDEVGTDGQMTIYIGGNQVTTLSNEQRTFTANDWGNADTLTLVAEDGNGRGDVTVKDSVLVDKKLSVIDPEGTRISFYNNVHYVEALNSVTSTKDNAISNVDKIVSDIFSTYSQGDVNVSDSLGALETLKVASTSYNSTGLYDYATVNAQQMGLATNDTYAFTVEWTQEGSSTTKEDNGQLFMTEDAFNGTVEVNKTYDASNETVWFTRTRSDGTIENVEFTGNFTVKKMIDKSTGESINSTSVQSVEVYDSNVSDLKNQLDELRESLDSYKDSSTGSGLLGGSGWFSSIFENVNQTLLMVVGVLGVLLFVALES